MKRGVQRAATTEFAHLVDDRPDGATAASPPRRGHAVSEAIVSKFVTAFDGIAIFGTGIVTMQWHSSTVDWRLEGLVVLLGSLLGLNFLRLAGADRFNQFADLGTSIGRALLGWMLTLAALFLAAPLVEPLTAAVNGPWIALWFSGGVVLLAASRVVLHQQMRIWNRAGRLGEVVAIVGAGPMAQRLLRSMNATPGGPRIFGVYDDAAATLPRRCMGSVTRRGWTRRSTTRLAARNLALCVADSDKMSTPVKVTADYAYFRLRDEGYTADDIRRWADTIARETASCKEVFVYFKHEDEGKGPKFAKILMRHLGLTTND